MYCTNILKEFVMNRAELRANKMMGHLVPLQTPPAISCDGAYLIWAKKTDGLRAHIKPVGEMTPSEEAPKSEREQRLIAARNMDFAARYGKHEDFQTAWEIYKNLA
jgi:hypothetical protein